MAKGKYHKWLEPEGLLKIESWARDGLIDEQIAKNMGISKTTLYDWEKRFPAFSNALKKGKEVVDIQVENALLKKALGYDYEESKDTYKDGVLVESIVYKKHVFPDTTAMIFWLKNRMPSKWRDKQDINANVNTNVRIEDYLKENGKLDF